MMECSANNFQSDNKNPSISTLIFMDVEATGLPSFLGEKNVHITEISLIAIDRNDFENDKSQRVLNKLSLCVRPRVQISPGAMSITGLYNDVLENQELFDESVPKLLKYFFRRLRSPVCLLAHNGKKYDFPLLQAELKRICYSLGPNVFCGDTLEALRSIINSIPKKTEPDKIVSIHTCANNKEHAISEIQINDDAKAETNFSKDPTNAMTKNPNCEASKTSANSTFLTSLSCDQDIEDLLIEGMDVFNAIDQKLNDIELKSKKFVCPSVTGNLVFNDEELGEKNDIAYRNEHTPTGKLTVPDDKGLKRRKNQISDPLFSPKKQYKSNGCSNSDVKRKLFENGTNSGICMPASKPQKMSFSLPKLYHYFFGEDPPQSHYAEADCITLSKVCQQVCSEFLNWIDENSFPFDEIREMW